MMDLQRRYSQSSSDAFIIFSSCVQPGKEEAYVNDSARAILSSLPSLSAKKLCSEDIVSFCKTWKGLFEKKMTEREGPENCGGSGRDHCFVEIIESGRRRYVVRGTILEGLKDKGKTCGPECYLFVFERLSPEKINARLVAKLWGLTRREEEIFRLLLSDCSNKEIAGNLDLSLNTVKIYMKLLMRKLGVSSRAGIVGCLLTREPAGPKLSDF